MRIWLAFTISILLLGCATPKPWPEPDWYSSQSAPAQDLSRQQALAAIVGRYAHYDVVAYDDHSNSDEMRTFIVSYGITSFVQKGDSLMQHDQFCQASQLINYSSVQSRFSDKAVQAIEPRVTEVELTQVDNEWHIYRPATPTLLGVTGDPHVSFASDFDAFTQFDHDEDGNPGVTVKLTIANWIDGELYIARREVFENHLVLDVNGDLFGHVVDSSEQHVFGANWFYLDKPSYPEQVKDPRLNPLVLRKLPNEVSDCAELMHRKSEFFPDEPSF